MGLTRGPGGTALWRADVRGARVRLLVEVMVLVFFVVVVPLKHGHQWGDVFTEARGPFPAAFASGAPVAPAHVVRGTTVQQALVHGLSVQETDSGVRAVNLRTGEEYWHYERRDPEGLVNAVSVSERTVVVGESDGRLVGIDVRTGKLLWRVDVREEGWRRVVLAGGQVVTGAPGAVRAFDERDGRSLWTVRTPTSCPQVLVVHVHALPEGLSAVQVMCNVVKPDWDTYDLLLGVDHRTGRVLWRQRTEESVEEAWSGHTRVTEDPELERNVQVSDVDRQGVSRRGTLPFVSWDEVAADDGTVLVGTDAKDRPGDRGTLLAAYDTRDGHRAWQVRAPAGQEYGAPEIVDGRVYVVRRPFLTEADKGRRIHAELLVLDADTGRPLHTLKLPSMKAPDASDDDEELDILDIADGALSIGWRGGGGGLLIAFD
ncbi:PQQ-binding-like beta-propeller repeat protein [Streptomyces sp. NPDC001935]